MRKSKWRIEIVNGMDSKTEMEMDNRNDEFIFEKLDVYHLAVGYYTSIREIKFSSTDHDRIIARQLLRAGLSISLNIAEGAGKKTPKDKRNYFLIARGSLYECVAIMNILKIENKVSPSNHQTSYSLAIRISKMLTALVKRMDQESLSPE